MHEQFYKSKLFSSVNPISRRKDTSNDLRETIVATFQSGKGYKAFSKLFRVHHSTIRKIIHSWKSFKTAVNLPRIELLCLITPRSDRARLRETAKKNLEKMTEQACLEGLQEKASSLWREHGSTG